MTWRRVKRLLWLAAWSFWAFVGWRLYVEFPRTLGEPIYRVDDDEVSDSSICFDPNTSRSVLVTTTDDGNRKKVRAIELGTNVEIAQTTFDLGDPSSNAWLETEFGRTLLVCARTHPICMYATSKPNGRKTLHVRDLDSGIDRALGISGIHSDESASVYFCDRKPWAVVVGHLDSDTLAGKNSLRVMLVDLHTGRLLHSWPSRNRRLPTCDMYSLPEFVPGTSDLVLSHTRREGGQIVSREVEVWRPPSIDKPVHVWRQPQSSPFRIKYAANGRAGVGWAFRKGNEVFPTLDVYDLDTDRILFSDPPQAARTDRESWSNVAKPGYKFSDDGRVALTDDGAVLVDTGELLYRNGFGYFVAGIDGSAMIVHEHWGDDSLIGRCIAFMAVHACGLSADEIFGEVKSFAYRDLRTGYLIARVPDALWPNVAANRYYIRNDETDRPVVYRCAPQVQWVRLLIVQFTLALPLLLVYSYRWWGWRRRKQP